MTSVMTTVTVSVMIIFMTSVIVTVLADSVGVITTKVLKYFLSLRIM